MKEKIIEKAENFARKIFEKDFGGHDFFHTKRVCSLAVFLAEKEGADKYICALSSLLHDVDDIKLSPETSKEKSNAVSFLKSQNVSENDIEKIIRIIDEVSFKGSDSAVPSTKEGRCVQDADRLDALGAIGIARTFAYGGSHHRKIYDPEEKPEAEMNEEEYRSHVSTSVNHFYEKLFLLKDMMNTDSARKIAEKRDKFMKDFLEEFYSEWDVKIK